MARRGKTIDYKEWRLLLGLTTTVAANAIVGVQRLEFSAPGTVLRLRMSSGLLALDASQQVSDAIVISVGYAIIFTDAATVGADVPDSASEFEYPWLWLGQWCLRTFIAAGVNTEGSSVVRISADSKAMRRIKPGQSLVQIVEATGAAGAPTTNIDLASTRVLVGT